MLPQAGFCCLKTSHPKRKKQAMVELVARTCREAFFYHRGHFESDCYVVWMGTRGFASVEVNLVPYAKSRSGQSYLSALEKEIHRRCSSRGLKVKRIHVGQFFVYGLARNMRTLAKWRKAMLDFPDNEPWIKHELLGRLYGYREEDITRFVARSRKEYATRKNQQKSEAEKNRFRPPPWVWHMPLDPVLEFPQDPRKRIRREKGIEPFEIEP